MDIFSIQVDNPSKLSATFSKLYCHILNFSNSSSPPLKALTTYTSSPLSFCVQGLPLLPHQNLSSDLPSSQYHTPCLSSPHSFFQLGFHGLQFQLHFCQKLIIFCPSYFFIASGKAPTMDATQLLYFAYI